DVAVAVGHADDHLVFAGGEIDRQRPTHPGEGRVEGGLQRGVGPAFAAVQRDFHAGNVARAGEGDTGQGLRSGVDLLAVLGMIDAAPFVHDGGVAPAAGLPVALEVLVDDLDAVDPFDVLHAVDVGNDEPGGETVVVGEHFAVHT